MYSEYLTKLMIVFTIVVVITCMNGVFAENGEVVIETVNDYSQAPDNPTNLQYANAFGENIKPFLSNMAFTSYTGLTHWPTVSS